VPELASRSLSRVLILACADDRAVVTEITDTNNCDVGVQSVTVK
jgi:hypothetical protein